MQSEELLFMSAVELAQKVRDKELSPVEVTDAFIGRIESVNPKLNAFCRPMFDIARDKAKRAEAAQMRGESWGVLHGVPYAIKDYSDYAGVPTTSCCVALRDYVPDRHSLVVARMEGAGAIPLGKTTTPDMAWKGLTDSPLFGESGNPWSLDHNPGGSSGGSAAAVAAGMAPLGTATDGAGSIRIPASFCGVYGIKPSFGRIPFPAPNVNQHTHEGPLARTVEDAALMLDVLAGPDYTDLFALEASSPGYLAGLQRMPSRLKIGWSPTLGFRGSIHPEVAKVCADAAHSFEAMGHIVEEVDLDLGLTMQLAKRNWSTIMSYVVFHRMAGHEHQLDPGLVACARESRDRLASDFLNDKAVLYQEYLKVVRYFEQYDLLLTPTVACLPVPNGRLRPQDYPDHSWDWLEWAPFSSAFNIFHNPAASVPAGFSESGLPIGLQFVGARHQDLLVLQASRAFEIHRPWGHRRPAL